jgi:hypothetical protein
MRARRLAPRASAHQYSVHQVSEVNCLPYARLHPPYRFRRDHP